MNQRFSDLHQHVLWGMDDGPRDAEAMHALLRQADASGIGLIAATAHAYPERRRFDMEQYHRRLVEAQAYCRKEGLPLQIVGGSEIRYCERVPDLLAIGQLPTLGESRHVLIEFSGDVALEQIGEAADRLYQAGYRPVLAHVERYRVLSRFPRRAVWAREEYGLIYQMNCDTVLSPRGFFERRFVRALLEEQAIDLIATDAHDAIRRPVRMREAFERLSSEYGEAYAQRLTRLGWELLNGKETDSA